MLGILILSKCRAEPTVLTTAKKTEPKSTIPNYLNGNSISNGVPSIKEC